MSDKQCKNKDKSDKQPEWFKDIGNHIIKDMTISVGNYNTYFKNIDGNLVEIKEETEADKEFFRIYNSFTPKKIKKKGKKKKK